MIKTCLVSNKIDLSYNIKMISRKATIKDNFTKRSTKKDKKINTENKYGKYTAKYVRNIDRNKTNVVTK